MFSLNSSLWLLLPPNVLYAKTSTATQMKQTRISKKGRLLHLTPCLPRILKRHRHLLSILPKAVLQSTSLIICGCHFKCLHHRGHLLMVLLEPLRVIPVRVTVGRIRLHLLQADVTRSKVMAHLVAEGYSLVCSRFFLRCTLCISKFLLLFSASRRACCS